MKRLLLFLAAGAFAATLHAQTTPQGAQPNANSNEPQVQIAPQRPSQQPAVRGPNPSGQQPAATVPAGTSAQAPAKTNTAPADQKSNASAPSDAPHQQGDQSGDRKLPTTVLLPNDKALPSADPVMEPGELPKGDVTLVGGTAAKVDRVRNRVVVEPFGGGKRMTVRFDERSHIYKDGRETTVANIKQGDRLYADTMLVGPYVFARNIRVQTASGPAEARGQVSRIDSRTGRVTMTDQLTSQPVQFTISRNTVFRGHGNTPAAASDVIPGSLIDVLFAAGAGKTGEAIDIAVLAKPGSNFVFAGRVTNLNLGAGLLSVDNQTDGKNYDLYFDPARVERRQQLRIGSEITARATFDGKNYRAADITVSNSVEQSAQQ